MAVITIDGKKHEVDEKQNLLHVCLSLGYNLPYFCWHPAMGSVGACRQCAVIKYKDENDDKGKLVMACMEPASDGTIISLKDPEAEGFRKEIIEWLMTNHPHDCPVCDEGGECHLQDMTVMNGHDYRRFRFQKRTYKNQYLGPFVNHEMNRCIQCYRCVRFYREYADGRDLDAFAAHNHVYFGRHKDGVLENEFSGNLVEICPTGVFTDKTLKQHYTRKWDLTTAPSICVHCGVGCNTIAGERYGTLRRILSRYNSQVNGYFLCDRGRFGYEYVNSSKRIKTPSIKNNGTGKNVDIETAFSHVKDYSAGEAPTIGIGSPRASIEANYLLKKYVGEDNFYLGFSPEEYKILKIQYETMKRRVFHPPSLKDVEKSDAVLILGEDITSTAPMLALAVRQAIKKVPVETLEKLKIPAWHDAAVKEAVQEERRPLYIASSYPTKLDAVSASTIYSAPDEISRIADAIAARFDTSLKSPDDLTDTQKKFVDGASESLSNAERPLIITGSGTLSESVICSAVNAANALNKKNKNLSLSFTFPDANSLGLMILGGKDPGLLKERKEELAVINLKTDLHKKFDEAFLNDFLNNKKLVTIDCLQNNTTERSDVVIPAGTFAESDGTFVNSEGRAQRYYQVYKSENKDIMETWRVIWKLYEMTGSQSEINYESILDEITVSIPELKEIKSIAPPPGFRIAGQKIPREPHRYSGRTAMHADVNVSEPKPPDDPDSALSFTMEGYRGQPPSSIIPSFWSPGWNSVQSINKYQIEVGGPLHGGDPGRRIFEKDDSADLKYFGIDSNKFIRRENEYLTIPVYHIFGSESLSSEAEAVKKMIPEQFIWMNPDDAAKIGVKKGELIQVNDNGVSINMPVKVNLQIPEGLAGISVLANGKKIKFNQFINFNKADD